MIEIEHDPYSTVPYVAYGLSAAGRASSTPTRTLDASCGSWALNSS